MIFEGWAGPDASSQADPPIPGPDHLPKSLKSRNSRKSSVFIAFFEKDSRKSKKSSVFIACFNLDHVKSTKSIVYVTFGTFC